MIKTRKNKLSSKKTRKQRVFKKGDFYSGDGFLTSVWGPTFWFTLHTISFNYPVKPSIEEKKYYRDYVYSLQNVLPCGTCRKNLKTNLKQLPLKMSDMASRDTFSRYIYELHELVNKMLKKKSNLSYCDVRERYEHFRARCTDEKLKLFPKFVKLNKTKKETGCTEPLYGKKARCILNIVPQEEKGQSIQIDKKCMKHRE
jgi:hypothetical protein